MRTILVVGGGHAGFYAAWKLEKKLRRDEARIVVQDPRRAFVTGAEPLEPSAEPPCEPARSG